MSKRNQLIIGAPIPIGYWKLHSVGNTDGIMKQNLPPLSDFDEVRFLQQKKESFFLVQLVRDGVISFGYVILKIKE
jgi:hypothetical protein